MDSIVIYIDNLERLHFYNKLMAALEYKDFIVLTNKMSIYLKLRNKVKIYLIKHSKKQHPMKIACEKTLSVLANYHSSLQALEIENSVLHTLEKVFSENSIRFVWLWNGTTTIGTTISEYFKHKNIDIKFFELSNLPGKIFVDYLGVNAKSSLYFTPETLDSEHVSDKEYYVWKKQYMDSYTIPKQAKNKTKIPLEAIWDYMGYIFLNCVKEDYRNPCRLVLNKLKNRLDFSYPSLSLEEEYIFFPLQVSSDSQILLNSDLNNIESLDFIKKKYPNDIIYIKIHPAEEDRKFIQQVESLMDDKIKLVGNSTQELILNAKQVITINSTVGLEAMIFEKDVEVLGRAVYTHFDHNRLKAYICRYLVNIDYFDDSIDMQEIQKLLKEKS